VIGLFTSAVPDLARSLGHYISFSITLAMMLFVIGYTSYRSRSRRGTFWNVQGPTILVTLAAVLIMADLFRHLFQDLGWWPNGPWPGSSEYRHGCEEENMSCLSFTGWLFTVVFTYTGFVLLFIGTMWSANLVTKLKEIRDKWVSLRQRQN